MRGLAISRDSVQPGARDPRSGRGQRASEGTPVFRRAIDAEHGSGTAGQDNLEMRCVNRIGARAERIADSTGEHNALSDGRAGGMLPL